MNILILQHPFATISITAFILIAISFVLALKLKNLMGAGKDTAPVKILLTVILVNGILGAYSVTSIYWKYVYNYVNYVRFSDVILLVIGLILVVSIYSVYRDYDKLLKKHEPNN